MKYLLLLAIVLFATPAQAVHHRQHVLDHLDASCQKLILAQKDLWNWERSQSDPDFGLFDRISGHLDNLLIDCHEIPLLLANPDADLKVIRRRLYQPWGGGGRSSATFYWAMLYETGYSITHRSESTRLGFKGLNRFLRSTALAWRTFDMAIWHIENAILEEIYLDPDFGP